MLDEGLFLKSFASKLMNTVVETLSSLNHNYATELFYVTRVKAIEGSNPSDNFGLNSPVYITGMESVNHQSLDVNHYFTEAKALFHQLYPHEDFLVKPVEVITTVDTEDVEYPNDVGNDISAADVPIVPPAAPAVVDEDMEYLLETLKSIS